MAELFQVMSLMAVPVAAMWTMRRLIKQQDRRAAAKVRKLPV